MKLKYLISAFAVAAGVAAQVEDLETTKDFHLYITESSNSSLVGWNLYACHVGPLARVLCITNDGVTERASAFAHQHKAEDEDENDEEDKGAIGPLLSKAYYFDLETAESKFIYPVGFDENDNMYLAAYGDGSHEAPAEKVTPWEPSHAMYNWYACRDTHVNSYSYHAINWALVPPPNEPGCDSVTIHRVYE
ncbi:hypothetical protein MCOR25_006195 [Pyricularia grisea]|uniref:DUF7907 domain-containing protein n=1 Tax=Pyricularia grisea TaxID=148305 RepID=A0A6P8BD01_PYRGI|nr:uncharacterized protein PgNI_04756 [Pyricularia grisea]KAI6362383.1 hypothetical protein MCOR25_006195 [Pyricularia grisea]TLD13639.1 hypothetical protein PgNI_04756 [Pyricularia grisea]